MPEITGGRVVYSRTVQELVHGPESASEKEDGRRRRRFSHRDEGPR